MTETAIVIVTALLSGLVATLITLWWQGRSQKSAEKRRIFAILMSKRYDIAAEESVEALNMLDVVFNSSKKVLSAWKEFNEATRLPESPTREQEINDKYLRMLEIIAEDIGYKNTHWDDIKRFYYPNGLSEKKQQEAILRKVQIDAGIAQIKRGSERGDAAQVDAQAEINNKVILKAFENPEGFAQLLEVVERAQNNGKSKQ